MATISGTDPFIAARLAYNEIRCLGEPDFDDLPIDDKIELLDLALDDTDIRHQATVHIPVLDLIPGLSD